MVNVVCFLLGDYPASGVLARAKPFPVPFLILVHSTHIYLPMKMEQCFETSAYKIQTPDNYPKESIQQTDI